MKVSKPQLAIIALISANIIWGASAPIFKWSLESIPPFTFVFVRFFLAAVMLLPFTLHRLKISRRDIPKVIALAFVGFILHIPTIFVGLTIAPSINASIISSSAPILLIIGSYFALKEKLKRKTLFGTMLGLVGILLIIILPIFQTGIEGELIGNLLFVVSMMSFAVFTILLKEFNLPYSPLTLTFWLFVCAAIAFFPLYLVESQGQPLQISSQGLVGILFGAVFTSNIAYMLFNFAIKHIHANEVGVFLYIDPIVTILIAIPLLGEKLTLSFLLGALLVFAGIFIAEGRFHYHPIHKLWQKRA